MVIICLHDEVVEVLYDVLQLGLDLDYRRYKEHEHVNPRAHSMTYIQGLGLPCWC